MKLTTTLAALTLAAGMTFSFAGCEKSRDELRPDMDRVMNGDHGPQSSDLREMASRLAPTLLQIDDVKRNPYKIVVVMKHMANKTENMPGRDLDIYLAKLQGNLTSAAASDRVAFKIERAQLARMQSEELGNPDMFEDAARVGQPQTGEVTAQYILDGTVYSMNNGRTSYYVFDFKLTNLRTGIQVWTGQYDVRTLN
ncbi:MAG TPA: hypothetical protein VHM90_17610 [Phycisphaerae bacterium]|jgi:hypothetical protein|nr:hypothetical protein [Phycisphaerae bacterium]